MPAQLVAVQPQFGEAGEAAQLGGDVPAQLVVVQLEAGEAGHIPQPGGDGAGENIADFVAVAVHLPADVQDGEVGEAAQRGGDGAAELVFVQGKLRESGQITNIRGQRAFQLLPPQVDDGHPVTRNLHARPAVARVELAAAAPQRHGGRDLARGGRPVVVEGHQRLAIGHQVGLVARAINPRPV